ncbi:MAG: 2-oxoglutarate oxidoreductase [Deltaproteobacteria bacterium]|nr:2-oxoglutarate oxidoreductase [Deltaproteobacteria bacterium]
MSAPTTIFRRPEALRDAFTHYCPGCTHGIIHRLVAETLDELGLRERTIGIAPVGCSVLCYNYFNCDMQEAAHGRAPALATGVKRVLPDRIVFTYQGDGDLASIGTAEIIHAANRGEKFTTIFVNNAIYGMTGGQMAPTTMPNQVTTTCPRGRDVNTAGWPIPVADVLAQLRTPAYIERVAVHTPRYTVQAKRAIRQAFQYQAENRCYSFVEVLSTCPTNWGKTPNESVQWLEDVMVPYFKLGLKKSPDRPPVE